MTRFFELLLSLSILVFLHELGHFTFAKLFKTKVEKFYLFFNPWFSIFKFKKGDTEYGLGWLPLGGYVKIAGMIDESMDKEQLKKPPQPWEFRSKPAWQRLLILLGGVLVNFILAFVIYIAVLWTWGDVYLPTREVNQYGIMVDSLGQEFGLQNGDKIISVNDKKIDKFSDIYKELLISQPHKLTIERNGTTQDIYIDDEDIAKILKHGLFFNPRFPVEVAAIADSSAAFYAGLDTGIRIVAVDTAKTQFFDQFKQAISQYKDSTVSIVALKNGDTVRYSLTIPDSAIIGIMVNTDLNKFYHTDTLRYGLISAIPAGINRTFEEISSYWKQLGMFVRPKTEAYKSVGSFFTIGKLFPKKWDWEIFWKITALLSIMLAILNLLPIPGLDGGHALFVLVEMITGKKPGDKFLQYAQTVGMIILLTIIVYALGNDIIRNIF